MLGVRDLPDSLVRTIVERKVVCSIVANTITGSTWKKHLKDRDDAARKRAEEEQKGTRARGDRTSAERRQREADMGAAIEARRRNAQKLIAAGAAVTIGTDNYWAAAAELSRTTKPDAQNHGIGSLIAIEGLVELGMSPAQALVAATRNGAIASRGLSEFGTIEVGKRADLVLLDADPLADISNIRRIGTVIREGAVIDRERLPELRVLSRPAAATTSSAR
jgi:imidazolonepropionase-like amidohydrolase